MSSKPSKYDLMQDVQINRARQWDKKGDSVRPREGNDAVEMVGASTPPTTPGANMVKTYVVVTGTSPNKLTKVCYKGEDGIETVVSTSIS